MPTILCVCRGTGRAACQDCGRTPRTVACPSCEDYGCNSPDCPDCSGAGEYTIVAGAYLACCGVSGQVVCPDCSGRGVIHEQRELALL